MNHSYIRYAAVSFVIMSMISLTSCQSWSESLKQSVPSLGQVTQTSWRTIQSGQEIVKEFVKKHPVLTAFCALAAVYGLYRIVKPAQNNDESETISEGKTVHFIAPYHDIQTRLYEALLNMHLEENNQEALGRYFDILQQFNLELSIERFGENRHLQAISIKLVELLNTMNDCLSLSDQPKYKDLYEKMLIKYAELLSLLTEMNKFSALK